MVLINLVLGVVLAMKKTREVAWGMKECLSAFLFDMQRFQALDKILSTKIWKTSWPDAHQPGIDCGCSKKKVLAVLDGAVYSHLV